MLDYKIGDVISGRFSSRPTQVTTAIVRGRPVTGQWHGDALSYDPDHGPDVWGYDTEVAEVLRQATDDDEQRAATVKRRHSGDTAVGGARATATALADKEVAVPERKQQKR